MPLLTTGIIKVGILAKGLLTWVLGGGGEAAAGLAGDLLENFVDTLLRRAPDPLRAALAAAEADILDCKSYQGLQVKDWPWVRDTAFTLLRRHNPTAAQVAAQNYDPDTLADTLMEGAGDLLGRFDNQPHQKQACHDVLRILLRHLLNQGDHLTEMEAALRGEILSRLSEILKRLNDLPDEIALRHLAGLSLLRPNAPEPFKRRRSANILLTARHTDLPLRGRQTEMDDLWQWATNRKEVAVRLLIGPGGHGKTRLALELCRRLERAGWRTGFAVDQWPTLSDTELARIMPPDRPTLIVLDYAAGRGAVLSALARLAHDWPENPAFRLLLIEREAGDWWSNCRSLPGAPEHFFADEKICGQVPMRILALPDNGPAEIYADALSVFATLLRRDIATLKSAPDWPAELRLPLFARARALLAVEAAETDGLTADNILNQLIDREEVLWRRELHGDSSDNNPAIRSDLDLVRQALTLLTLSSPTSVCDADTLLCRLPRLASHSIETRERFLKALHPLYGDCDLLRGLEPDLLGEHLVWRTVKSPTDPLLIAATGNEASEAQAQTALTILNRLAARKPDAVEWLRAILDRTFDRLAVPAFRVALEQPLPMADLFREVMDRLTIADALALAKLLPDDTTELLEIAVHIEQFLVNNPVSTDTAIETQLFRAHHLGNLACRLGVLGKRKEALMHSRESVRIYYSLSEDYPGLYDVDLALALNNLGNHLAELGLHEEAFEESKTSVNLYRGLLAGQPDKIAPMLAMALVNMSNHLSSLGQREAALTAIKEGTDFYQSLVEKQPATFLRHLAAALCSLARCQSQIGHEDQALCNAKKGVEIYDALAEKQPDAFLPEKAMALNNIAGFYAKCSQWQDALMAAKKSTAIYCSLSKRRPATFAPNLAMALHTLSHCLSKVGQQQRALTVVKKAISIRRRLAEKRPDAFMPDLSSSISELGYRLREMQRFDEALVAAREALVLLLPFFRRRPLTHGGNIARYVCDCFEAARALGQEPDAELLGPVINALIEYGFAEPIYATDCDPTFS